MQARDIGLITLGGVATAVLIGLFLWVFRSNKRTTLQGGADERRYKRLCLVKADWCPHCKAIVPIFKKLRKIYPHTFAVIDGPSMGVDFLRRNRIKAYPMMGVLDTRTKQLTGLRVASRNEKVIVAAAAELL